MAPAKTAMVTGKINNQTKAAVEEMAIMAAAMAPNFGEQRDNSDDIIANKTGCLMSVFCAFLEWQMPLSSARGTTCVFSSGFACQ